MFKASWLGLAATWDSGRGWNWMERTFYRILCCFSCLAVSDPSASKKNRVKSTQTVSLYHGRMKWWPKAAAQNMHSFCNLLDNLWYIEPENESSIIIFSSIKRTKLIWEWDKNYWHIWSKYKKNQSAPLSASDSITSCLIYSIKIETSHSRLFGWL